MVARCIGKIATMGWLLLASMLAINPAFAAVSAHVDRRVIGEGETVNLVIDVSGNNSGNPNTTPLEKNFKILSRNHSSSYSLINGSMSRDNSWQLMLRPRRTGQLTILPIKVGQAYTQAITLQVKKLAVRKSPGGQPMGNIWIDMETNPNTVLVQQQTILSIKVYMAAALSQAQLSEPKAKHAVIERLGKDKQYQVTKNGHNWQVTERRYAVFPQQRGTLSIAPVQLDATIIDNQTNLNSPFFQPGMGSPFFQSSRPVRIRSNALVLQVKPIPVSWHGANWLPSSALTLGEDWPTDAHFKVGEPITRTLTIRAQGLSNSQLPGLPSLLLDHLKAYPDQPILKDVSSDQGIMGTRQEKIAIIPTVPGTYILPAIKIPWWNINSRKMQIAMLPPRTFKVGGAVSPVPATHPSYMAQPPAQTQLPAGAPEPHSVGQPEWWKPVAIIAICGWLLTMLLLWVKLRGRKQQVMSDRTRPSGPENLKAAQRAVNNVCNRNDAKACEQALLHFAAIRWPQAGGGMEPLRMYGDTVLNRELTRLEQHLYGSASKPWQGESLLRTFEQADFHAADKRSGKRSIKLPTLYPQ